MPDELAPDAEPDRVDPADVDDTTVTVDRTRIGSRRRRSEQAAQAAQFDPINTAPSGRRSFAVTLPAHPPVNDHRRLDFSRPEVLPGQTTHYPVRAAAVRDLPPFEVGGELSQRLASLPQRRAAAGGAVASAELQRSRIWRVRVAVTIAGSTLAAAVLAAAGFYGLARL